MTAALSVDVIGTPAPQGSKTYKGHRNGKPILVESSAAVRPWRVAVGWDARHAMARARWQQLTGPVSVAVTFYLPRPQSVSRRRLWPHVKPDLDKLVRSTLDGLTEAGVYRDDALVVEVYASKRYADAGRPLGARITVTEVTAPPSTDDERTTT